MHPALKTTLCLLVAAIGLVGATQAQAATKTICGAGGTCDYTSLTAAFGDSPAEGDVFQVVSAALGGVPYNPAAETWPIVFPAATTTVECAPGVTIGQPTLGLEDRVYLSAGATIQNCTFGNIELRTNPVHDAVSPDGIVIQNNVFSTSVSSTIDFSSAGAISFLIQDNTNINYLGLSSSTDGIVQNNTFYGNYAGHTNAAIVNASETSGRIRFIGNTFTNYSLATGGSMSLVHLGGSDQTFASNTIRYAVNFPIEASIHSSLEMNATGTNYIGGNYIYSPNGDGCTAVTLYTTSDQAWSGDYTVLHNTIYRQPYCAGGGAGVSYSTGADRPDISATINISYNLFYNASSSAGVKPAVQFERHPLTALTQSNAHNGIYNFGAGIISSVSLGEASEVADATTIYTDPILRSSDVDTSNDLEVAPFSGYLDVVGSQDIGATNIARRSTIFVDDSGSVDYLTVDATSTSVLSSVLRTGDTVMLAAGTYNGFSVNSANATSSITIQGAGATTIIDAGGGADALSFTSVSSSHIADLVVRNATGVGSASYTMTNVLAHFGSTDYNESFGMLGVGASQLSIFTSSASCDGGPPFTPVTADGDTITSATFGGTTNFHLAALQIMGAHITVLLPSSQFANQAAFEAYFSGVCGLPGPAFSVDAFADNLFTVSGGIYAYDAGSLLSSGMTLVSGVTAPPAITYIPGMAFSGIKFTGSSNNNTISGVTSTNNGYGVRFVSTGDSYNTVSDSTFSGNTYYDVIAGGNAYNVLDNDSFTRASSSVSGSGSLLVKYRARVHVTDVDGGGNVSGVTASSTDAALTATSFGATTGAGYTSYLRLPAYVIDAGSNALTNGGYNPYNIRTTAIAGYSASSSEGLTLSSPDQVFSIAAVRTLPAAPSGVAASDITTSTLTVTWSDNATNNSATVFEYVNINTGQSSVDELSENSIGAGLVGLQPNAGYLFRIAARNAGGTSAFDTSAVYYMLADTPATPVVSAVSQTAVSVGVPADANATSTEYAIYSSTLGGYLSGAGSVSPSPTWQTSSTWSTLTVSGLTCGTSYSFATIARNHDEIESTTSTAAAATTSACSVVSSGGGGGGGGGGGAIGGNSGGSSAIQTFFTPAVPRVIPQEAVTSTPVVVVQPATTTEVVIAPVTTTTPSTSPTLEQFLREGTTPASRALGRGEREAILRDMQEVLGVPAARILVSDLELVAGGQIPRTRNLAYERSMAPRALVTFRTMFGHAPNFRNASENLAWNTLMYRIRFARDLSSERQGILAFRRVFRSVPQTPFQWAVVRVLGYIVR